MDTLFAASKYLSYRLRASNEHGIHSPFVFDLFNNVIKDETPFYGFELIESLRSRHLLDIRKINITDFGTGNNKRQERICDIARKSVKSKKFGQLLFRLVNKFNPENILELGTSLGITTLYLSLPKKDSKIITLEGCPETAALAQNNFNRLKRTNIELICSDFTESLPEALKKFNQLDMVFFDGNHRREATLSYFNQCLNLVTENSVFIFDDIHWSREMELAWKEIKRNNKVSTTIDLYQLGIVFFQKGMTKQHFTLRF
jgi:predicted O-methyltransferase YrrM